MKRLLLCAGLVACGGSGATGGDGGSRSLDATADARVTSNADAASPSDASSEGDHLAPDASDSSAHDGSRDAGTDAVAETCTDLRPQLTTGQANLDTILDYLAQAGIITSTTGLSTDHWDPTGGVGDVTTFTPTYTVDASGAYATVQSAIDAAVARGGTDRIYILVSPGTYREVDCVPSSAPPITLYSTAADASTPAVIVYNNYNGESKDAGATANPCSPNPSATTFGTAGSATFAVFANGFQAKNITFSNDVSVATLAMTTGTQAVALMTQADQIVLDTVQVLGHQDTLYMETPSEGTVVRSYVKNSYITGDTDFIFGGATMVLDTCQIQFVSDRKSSGSVLSPSTASLNMYGILVDNATFTADSTTGAASVGLGRAWDRSCVDVPTYLSSCVTASDYPNGQAVVRNSTLGAQIATNPWLAAATTKRGFCGTPWECLSDAGSSGVCPANRLYEYQNTGPGAAP
jgi:pectinesterase